MQRLSPVPFARLAAKKRTPARNWQLGIVLAFVAGFVNAGGLFLVGRYTSHMTGVLSELADTSAIGQFVSVLKLSAFIVCFVTGSVVTTLLVISARRRAMHAQYSIPLAFEAVLLSGIVGLFFITGVDLTLIIALLCFLMGVQNALITKASTSVVRTTHVTGMVTDLGIELGRTLLSDTPRDREIASTKVALFLLVLSSFLIGGVIGALLISRVGALGLLPVIFLLVSLAVPGILRDVRSENLRRHRHKRSVLKIGD